MTGFSYSNLEFSKLTWHIYINHTEMHCLWCYIFTSLFLLLQASGSGSQTAGEDALVDHGDVLEKIEKVENRVITVRFNSDTASSMQWNFRPQQTEVKVSQCDELS